MGDDEERKKSCEKPVGRERLRSQTETCPFCSRLGRSPLWLQPCWRAFLWRARCNGRKFGNLTLRSGSARGSCTNTLEFLRRTPFRSRTKSSYRTTSLSLHYTLADLHPQLARSPARELVASLFPRVSFRPLKLFIRLGSETRDAFMMVGPFVVLTIN